MTQLNAMAGNASVLLAACDSGLFRSLDKGDTWLVVNTGLKSPSFHSIALSGSNIFVGTHENGVIHSVDNGKTWSEMNEGWSNQFVFSLIAKDSILFAGTAHSGVWKIPIPMPSNSVRYPLLKTQESGWTRLQLRKGEPVRFKIMRHGMVNFDVTDLDGKKVATLSQGFLEAGEHTAFLDVPLKTGFYILRLRADGVNRAGKVFVAE